MHFRVPASPVSMECDWNWGARCQRLVPSEWGSMGTYPPTPRTSSTDQKTFHRSVSQWGTAVPARGSEDIRGLPGCTKLSPNYIEPYKILKRINLVIYRLELPWHSRIHPSFCVSRHKPVISGPLAETVPPSEPPTLLDIDGEHAYIISKILRLCRRNGRLKYLVVTRETDQSVFVVVCNTL